MNTMILTCTHIILQCWYFAIPASAFNPFDLGEDPGLRGVDCMTTPVLQNTFFILKKEKESLSEPNTNGFSNVLSEVMVRYEVKMREHIQLLEHEDKPKEVIDIFTKDEQEKLGGYGIQLEKKWSPNDGMELYEAWGSCFKANPNFLVCSIDSAEQLCQCQRKMPYGIFDPDPEEEEAIFDELDKMIFWVQNFINHHLPPSKDRENVILSFIEFLKTLSKKKEEKIKIE
ncbi:hypothetical protein DFH28DRAFT_925872 [Melampsora americana]|nr:hypothetical protein DFH28DRAFT_925872 [Melampsora americana]